MKTGIANLPLHYGAVPVWLFERMKRLSKEIVKIIIWDFGPEEFLARLSNPYWFQSFGMVLGFDWHSSGLTTTVGGALKEALRGEEDFTGIFVCGGKGSTSRRTPQEISLIGEKYGLSSEKVNELIYASKTAAKVDSAAIQDGFELYHHNFIFTLKGEWTVIQQGFNLDLGIARRYHWLSDNLKSFVEEPHTAIICDQKTKTLNLTAKESRKTRDLIVKIVNEEQPRIIKRDLEKITILNFPLEHEIKPYHFDSKRLLKTIEFVKALQPENFEKLLGIKGVGAKTLLALTLIGELIYGTQASWRDPVRFSFAHGGKDGTPYPINIEEYDRSITILRHAIKKAKISRSEKINLLNQLSLPLKGYE